MSTPAILAVQTGDTVRAVYLHSDGMPQWAGRCLLEHYNSQEQAEALIDLGGLSHLDARLAPDEGEIHSFLKRAPGVTVAYHRDNNEPLDIVEVPLQESLCKTLQSTHIAGDYAYLFHDGAWHMARGNAFRKLTEANTRLKTRK